MRCSRDDLCTVVQSMVALADKSRDAGYDTQALNLLVQWNKDNNTLVLKDPQPVLIRKALDEFVCDVQKRHPLLLGHRKVKKAKEVRDTLVTNWEL